MHITTLLRLLAADKTVSRARAESWLCCRHTLAKQVHCLLSMVPAHYTMPGGGQAVVAAALASQDKLITAPQPRGKAFV